jgi:hypothetical protein
MIVNGAHAPPPSRDAAECEGDEAMGTRADFYSGKDESAEWLGSIAWDGYRDGIDAAILGATNDADFRAAVAAFLAGRDDATTPDMGWPWPWDTSAISDCSYWHFDGKTWDDWGGGYAPCDSEIPDEDADPQAYADFVASFAGIAYPNMAAVKNATLGPRSGVIVFGAR